MLIMRFQHLPLLFCFLSTFLWTLVLVPAHAESPVQHCHDAKDRACVAARIYNDAKNVDNERWHDQVLRDLAASKTYDGDVDGAIGFIKEIKNPDTQAMTVRTIGMAAALYRNDTEAELKSIFKKLDTASSTITQPAARAIAYTYVAMSQAFAGLDDDAWATASAMKNDALRYKAFGETAEIQAERGDIDAAMKSIAMIDTTSFRNKSYQNIASILIKQDMFTQALEAAQAIDNPMKRAQTLQKILTAQEVNTRGTRNDVGVGQK